MPLPLSHYRKTFVATCHWANTKLTLYIDEHPPILFICHTSLSHCSMYVEGNLKQICKIYTLSHMLQLLKFQERNSL